MAKKEEKIVKEEKKVKKVNKTKKEKKNKNKEGLVTGVKKELKMVKWPTIKELIKYTGAVIILCIILVAFFQCLDIILAYIKGMIS